MNNILNIILIVLIFIILILGLYVLGLKRKLKKLKDEHTSKISRSKQN